MSNEELAIHQTAQAQTCSYLRMNTPVIEPFNFKLATEWANGTGPVQTRPSKIGFARPISPPSTNLKLGAFRSG
ncbi:hypothetical protein PAXINDRAFT_168971 [Paxillus involutus ATCC 200175]|uniref:Uncharacterized protein n=1 Tax=Paxillus involutus ATCC 200175 TaxID=664439 RepID=A0A0C9SZB4_PAXIN|nr:hypothetical protein PAXINDRAFT_168971 [Paxillus involutus ATCC 200175]